MPSFFRIKDRIVANKLFRLNYCVDNFTAQPLLDYRANRENAIVGRSQSYLYKRCWVADLPI